MNTAVITWISILGLFAVILLVKVCRMAFHSRQHHPLFEVGSERDEFFVPGDPEFIYEEDEKDCCDDFGVR